MMKQTRYTMAKKKNEALQLNRCVAMPDEILPTTNPTGFPALKQANAMFLRRDGVLYAAPKMPIAGGTEAADQRPRIPLKISRYMAFVAKPVIKFDSAKAPMLEIKMPRRPKVSAILEKNRRKDPAVRLCDRPIVSACNPSLSILSM